MVRTIATTLLFALAIFAVSTLAAHAQTASPQFLVTWHAGESYIPPAYTGKALPTIESRITASLEVIINGKLVDLSGQTIYWYLNTNYIGGGTGAQTITFSPDTTPPATLDLQVKLPSLGGQAYIHDVLIPLVEPSVVIYAPYPNGVFTSAQADLKALPYFFNATSSDNLSFSWTANGQPGTNTENPDEVLVNLPQGSTPGTELSVTLSVENPQYSTTASAYTNLVYQPL